MVGTFASVLFGLVASLCWGSGDFCGGLASRRASASTVVALAYTFGFVLLLSLAVVVREPFLSLQDMLWGGVAGVLGLVSFYSALSIGRMGIVAPISAVLSAGLPVLFSAVIQGVPSLLRSGGFVLALLAIVFISRPGRAQGRPGGVGLALLAGCGFGCFFILISRVSSGATLWPLAVARFTSVLFLLGLLPFRGQRVEPRRASLPLVLLAGGLDALGNAFFILAAHAGRLDVASVLSALYPAATILLAAFVLRERVTRIQSVGILLALVAIPLISA
ncbi:MAG TPA: DMT family transporter [Ktedonobacteraceae bacterium]|jgi:drug/metabolite transporter (DMT)-like permease